MDRINILSEILMGNSGKQSVFPGILDGKHLRSFGSFSAVKCTNRLSAIQAVNPRNTMKHSLIIT